jgi:hypothetical protein
MGITKTFKETEYIGRIYEAKDNMVVETRTGKNSVSLSAPIDFVDKVLKDFVNQEVKVTITVQVEKD